MSDSCVPCSGFFHWTNIEEVLSFGEKTLHTFENPKLESELLLADIIGKERSFLRTHLQKSVSLLHRWKFSYRVHLRAQHIPLAYIRGWKEWAGFKISLSPAVLIPRDETEVLIEKIRSIESPSASFLDIGTGSGCISIALAHYFPNATIEAVDISRAALSVAQKNFRTHRVRVKTTYSDLLSVFPSGMKSDVLVANLPYVPTKLSLSPEVQREPEEALLAGVDGLEMIRKLAQQIQEKRISFTALWLEFLPQQWNEVQIIFQHYSVTPFSDVGGDIYFARICPKKA